MAETKSSVSRIFSVEICQCLGKTEDLLEGGGSRRIDECMAAVPGSLVILFHRRVEHLKKMHHSFIQRTFQSPCCFSRCHFPQSDTDVVSLRSSTNSQKHTHAIFVDESAKSFHTCEPKKPPYVFFALASKTCSTADFKLISKVAMHHAGEV